MIKAKFFFILFLILTSFSCVTKSKKPIFEISTPTYSTSNQYIIYEDSLQNITLNDRPISVNALDSSLKELKIKGGLVFYRCKEQANCLPGHGLVIDLISKYSLKLNVLISKPEYEYIPADKEIR